MSKVEVDIHFIGVELAPTIPLPAGFIPREGEKISWASMGFKNIPYGSQWVVKNVVYTMCSLTGETAYVKVQVFVERIDTEPTTASWDVR